MQSHQLWFKKKRKGELGGVRIVAREDGDGMEGKVLAKKKEMSLEVVERKI